MMKLLWLAALVACTAADVSHLFRGTKPPNRLPVAPRRSLPVAPASSHADSTAAILKSDSNINPDGSYQWAYETENGISAEEQGQQKNVGPDSANTVQGSFQYGSPEGIPVVVQYIADENGFQAYSDILPTSPPIPDYILKALAYIAAHPQPEDKPILRRF